MHPSAISSSHHTTIFALQNLRPRQKLTYFVGFLDGERSKLPRGPVHFVAEAAFELMEQGKVLLTQKRLSPPVKSGMIDWTEGMGDGFEYIATGALDRRFTWTKTT